MCINKLEIIGVIDLSAYSGKIQNLILSFYYNQHGEEQHENDKVWIRGSNKDSWIEVYDLYENRAKSGEWKYVEAVKVGEMLVSAGQQLSSTFQMRFGQEGRYP